MSLLRLHRIVLRLGAFAKGFGFSLGPGWVDLLNHEEKNAKTKLPKDAGTTCALFDWIEARRSSHEQFD